MRLAVMIRAHARARLLDRALREALSYIGDPQVVLLVDHALPPVREVIDRYAPRLARIHELDFRLLSPEGERFMEGCQIHYDLVKRLRPAPDWVYFADDDRWFSPGPIAAELPSALADPNVDVWYARSLFLWDSPRQYNARRCHCSPAFFRFRERDQFPLHRTIQAPLPLHDEAIIRRRIRTLETPLLDYSTLDAAERERVFRSFVAAGKRDDYVLSLMQPPQLEPVPPQYLDGETQSP